MEAVDEDGMSSPENGGGARGGPSELAAVAVVETSNDTANSERRPNALKRIGRDASFAALPNLIVIDGGPGQLSAGLEALAPLRERGVVVVSLAKRIEEVFLPGVAEPLRLAHDTPELQLLQRVRDEAHRFALDFHRQRRQAKARESIFDTLQGVGPARRRALLRHFGSAERFLAASQEELEGVPGIPARTARAIYAQLHKAGRA